MLDEQGLRRRAERAAAVELETRWEIDPAHPYHDGIAEDMSIDATPAPLFGASKVGRRRDGAGVRPLLRHARPTCFRGGCLTGPQHAGAELHGFLAYLMRCALAGRAYTIFGYKGKQVRDNIHSHDLVRAFDCVVRRRRASARSTTSAAAASRTARCSRRSRSCRRSPAASCEWRYDERNRIGDHIWWVGSNARFAEHYPDVARRSTTCRRILEELHAANLEHWRA